MLTLFSLFLVLTAIVFAVVVMAMTLKDSWAKVVSALKGLQIVPARQYRVTKVRNAARRSEPTIVLHRMRAAA